MVSRVMRVPIQAFVAPWISALMFIFIFGYVVGGRISAIAGHRYIEFVLPGILMLNVVNAAFLQSTSQIYFSALPALYRGNAGRAALLCRDDRRLAVDDGGALASSRRSAF